VKNLIVVDKPNRWPIHVPGVPIVAARTYLTDLAFGQKPGLKVFNLCRSYRYQSSGYYVSLLAVARGHKPIPSIPTIQDMRTIAIARIVAEDLTGEVQRLLQPLRSERFTLSIYFGRNLAKRYDALSMRLFRMFPVPLLRAEFSRGANEWKLQSIRPIAANDIPESHRPFVIEAATEFFVKAEVPRHRAAKTRYDLAILVNPQEPLPPSSKQALRHFAAAAKRLGLAVYFIGREDYAKIAEFDALFIRETTFVDHHTFRFARRAEAEGLVVIDDPNSILRCTNKVYLAELLARHSIPAPRTMIVHRDNRETVGHELGFPCILKLPDSSYSQGVLKADDEAQLQRNVESMLERSDLLIAQEFVPTEFDWRIGVLDGLPLYACKYFMVKKHWQIYKEEAGAIRDADAQAVDLEQVPTHVVRTAVRACRHIGNGLYGVDLKQFGSKVVVMEVNDNPSIDAGCEDGVLKEKLYEKIMGVFLERLERRTAAERAKR
jgi:glutathione synthase/RimK-type ligase-like ATP-grasp enzyme